MKKFASCLVLLFVASGSLKLSAQEKGLFTGKGFGHGFGGIKGSSPFGFYQGSQNSNPPLVGNGKSKWDFPKFNLPKWETPKWMQRQSYPKPTQFSDTPATKKFPSMPKLDLLPERDPHQPNFFQRMNERTKDIFGRSKEEPSHFDNGSNSTWDSITRGLGGKSMAKSDPPPPLQPQLRAARHSDEMASRF